MCDAQGDPTCDSKTVTHTSNGKEKFTDTSNRNFEQKLLINRTLPVIDPTMNPSIYPRIVTIVAAPQTLFIPETKEVVADSTCSNAWVNRTLRQVIRNGVDRSTPGDICNDVSV